MTASAKKKKALYRLRVRSKAKKTDPTAKISGDHDCLQQLTGDLPGALVDLINKYVDIAQIKSDLEAVKQNGLALRDVTYPTQEIHMVAVKQNADALQYVKNQTHELCVVAIQKNPCADRKSVV